MKSLILSLMDGDPITEGKTPVSPAAPQTRPLSEAESIEREEARKLVAYCEHCEEWWKFVRDMSPTAEEEVCPTCGGKPSRKVGSQITTQRTFNPKAKKMTVAQIKKMNRSSA